MRKPAFCICENKDADQLRGNREADQHLCFRYTDSTIPLLSKSEISSLYSSSVVVQPGMCRTWAQTPKTGFLTTRVKYILILVWNVWTILSKPAQIEQLVAFLGLHLGFCRFDSRVRHLSLVVSYW